jgi:HD-like signal output (HDOD) protein
MAVETVAAGVLRDKALSALQQLPPFSPTLSKLLATLAKEDIFFGELAGIIEKDTVLAGHVLKMVNSALYARSGTVNSVRHAVSILGLNKLRNLALSLSVARMWKQIKTPQSWSQGGFNLHSVAAAVMSDLLAQQVATEYPEGAFTAGLLHGMGKLMIAVGLPAEYDDILRMYQESADLSIDQAEQLVLGCSHADLAAAALAQWHLPPEIQKAVADQCTPQADTPNGRRPLSMLLSRAHHIINSMGVVIPACASTDPLTTEELFAELGLESKAAQITAEFDAEFQSMRSFF